MNDNIRVLNGYILEYCPDSKYSMKSKNWNGWVYQHMLVLEKLGIEIHNGYEVHHLDEDKQNNHVSNLIVLTKADHTKLHNWLSNKNKSNYKKKIVKCVYCGKILQHSQSTYCSIACKNKAQLKKPEKEKLLKKTLLEISETYGVTKKTARNWFKSYNIMWKK